MTTPWRLVLRFYGLVVTAAAVATLLVAWHGGATAPRELADLATMVSFGVAMLSLPFMGPGRFSEAYRLDADPGDSESQHARGNRALGVLGLAGAVTWGVIANGSAYMLR